MNRQKIIKYVEALVKNNNITIDEKYKQIHDLNHEIRNDAKLNDVVHYLHDIMSLLEKEKIHNKRNLKN